MLVSKLQAAGVPVEARTYPSVTHEFFGMGAVVGEAKAAEDFASVRLSQAFAQAPATAPRPVCMMRGRPVYRPAAQ